MSRRTQLTTKFIFQVLAQLSENFIFIYLGLSLFTEQGLDFRPLFILVTVVGICVARWLAVFPLSSAINWVLRTRARRKGKEAAEEIPFAHQAMLFWAGLRGAVGVALAAGLTGPNSFTLRATVLLVVVLTVIIFGGTTARMLEILGIRMGVVEEIDSDDEFDIEVVRDSIYTKRSGNASGHNARASANGIALDNGGFRDSSAMYSSGSARGSPPDRPESGMSSRKNSKGPPRDSDVAFQGFLGPDEALDDGEDDLDLPPAAKRTPGVGASQERRGEPTRTISAPNALTQQQEPETPALGAGLRQFLAATAATAEDPATWFRQIDEGFIKPTLLLDPGNSRGHGSDAV